MAIGSRQNSLRRSMRAPKFLDKAAGFYGRLEEPDAEPTPRNGEDDRVGEQVCSGGTGGEGGAPCPRGPGGVHLPGPEERTDPPGMFGFNQGMLEDDGEALLLSRKPSRGRWRRRSSRRRREEAGEPRERPGDGVPTAGLDGRAETPAAEVTAAWAEEGGGRGEEEEEEEKEEGRGDAEQGEKDDRVLIKDKKRGREEEEEREEKTETKTEGGEGGEEEGGKVVKRSAVNNYRKAIDRAFRRGWETFISNLYSVTLIPVTPSSSSSSPSSPLSNKQKHHRAALAEFR